MSVDLILLRPRPRGAADRRPATRSSGRAASAGFDPDDLATRFGTPLYVYDLDVIERQVAALTGRPPAGGRPGVCRQGEPGAERRGPSRPPRARARTSRRAASSRRSLRAGIAPGRVVMTGPGKRDDELRAGGRGRGPSDHRGIARRTGAARARSPRDAGRVQPVLAPRRRSPSAPGSSGSDSSATTERASSGWTRRTSSRRPSTRGRLAAPRPARAPRIRRVERPRRVGAGRACRGHGPHGAPAGDAASASRSGSSTPAAGSASRTSRTRNRSTSSASGRGLAAIVAGWPSDPILRGRATPARARSIPRGTGRARTCARRRPQDRRRVDGRHPRRRRPPPAAARPGRPGAPDPGVRRRARRVGSVPVTVAGPLCSGLDVFSQGVGHGAAGGRRPRGGPRRRRLRLHRIDAALPVPPDPGRGRGARRRRGAHPAAAGPRGVAGPPDPGRVVAVAGSAGERPIDGPRRSPRPARRRCRRPRSS